MSRRVYHPDMRALVLASLSWAAATAAPPAWAQGMATADRLQGPGWWPTKGTAPRAEYVGSAACARCHRQLGTSQAATPMAHTEAPAALSPVFRDHPTLEFHLGPYSYRVDTHDGKSVYTVDDGAHSVSAPLGRAFGAGRVGQSTCSSATGRSASAATPPRRPPATRSTSPASSTASPARSATGRAPGTSRRSSTT